MITFQNKTIREAILNSKLQIFEVKQLAELEDKYRKQFKIALCAYRLWQRQYKDETDVVELLYGQLRGIILRRNAENAARGYWVIRQDFRVIFKNYLSQNTNIQTNTTIGKVA